MHISKHIILAALLAWPFSAFAAEKKSFPTNQRMSANLTLADALARTLRESPELAAFSWDFRADEVEALEQHIGAVVGAK